MAYAVDIPRERLHKRVFNTQATPQQYVTGLRFQKTSQHCVKEHTELDDPGSPTDWVTR
jgi:hypothetical protein